MIKLFKDKIIIKPSFFIVILFMFIFDYIEQFFIIISMVTIHEFAHIITAYLFSLKTDKIIFTPIGEIAIIKGIEKLSYFKRCIIVFAGPLANIIIVIFAHMFNLKYIRNINITIALFNLLPIYPLDGGRILQYTISRKIGIIWSNRVIIKISNIIGYMLFVMGIIQLILFNYNISLLCIGIYLIKINKKEHIKMTFEFYRTVTNKGKNNFTQIKNILIDKNTNIKDIISKFCWDYYFFIYISENNSIRWKIEENDIIDYIQVKGLHGSVYDIIQEFYKL